MEGRREVRVIDKLKRWREGQVQNSEISEADRQTEGELERARGRRVLRSQRFCPHFLLHIVWTIGWAHPLSPDCLPLPSPLHCPLSLLSS